MSLKAMTWALKKAPVGADCTARLLLTQLADRADDKGRGAFPSVQTLAAEMRVTGRTVRRKLKEMEDLGVIVRGDQQMVAHYRGGNRPVVWDLNLGCESEIREVTICHPSKNVENTSVGDDSSAETGNDMEPGDCLSDTESLETVENTDVSEDSSLACMVEDEGDSVWGVTNCPLSTSGENTDNWEVTSVSPVVVRGDMESQSGGDISGHREVTPVSPKPITKPNKDNHPPHVPPQRGGTNEQVDEVCDSLMQAAAGLGVSLKPMKVRDGRGLGELVSAQGASGVLEVAKWAWSDAFWSTRIRSLAALVRNFDMLLAQWKQSRQGKPSKLVVKDPHRMTLVTTPTGDQVTRVPVWGLEKIQEVGREAHLFNLVAADECRACLFDSRNRCYHGDVRARLLPAMKAHPSSVLVSSEFGGAA